MSYSDFDIAQVHSAYEALDRAFRREPALKDIDDTPLLRGGRTINIIKTSVDTRLLATSLFEKEPQVSHDTGRFRTAAVLKKTE